VTDRFRQFAEPFLEPRPDERRLCVLAACCLATALWLAIALRQVLLLAEVPALAWIYLWLITRRRRRAAERGDDPVEDWSF
jgi:hypothetical protein